MIENDLLQIQDFIYLFSEDNWSQRVSILEEVGLSFEGQWKEELQKHFYLKLLRTKVFISVNAESARLSGTIARTSIVWRLELL